MLISRHNFEVNLYTQFRGRLQGITFIRTFIVYTCTTRTYIDYIPVRYSYISLEMLNVGKKSYTI